MLDSLMLYQARRINYCTLVTPAQIVTKLAYHIPLRLGQKNELDWELLGNEQTPGQKATLDGSSIYQACGKRVQIASSSLYTSSTSYSSQHAKAVKRDKCASPCCN